MKGEEEDGESSEGRASGVRVSLRKQAIKIQDPQHGRYSTPII